MPVRSEPKRDAEQDMVAFQIHIVLVLVVEETQFELSDFLLDVGEPILPEDGKPLAHRDGQPGVDVESEVEAATLSFQSALPGLSLGVEEGGPR